MTGTVIITEIEAAAPNARGASPSSPPMAAALAMAPTSLVAVSFKEGEKKRGRRVAETTMSHAQSNRLPTSGPDATLKAPS
jgi:hypothetical protein